MDPKDGKIVDDYHDEDFSSLHFERDAFHICRNCNIVKPMVTFYKTRFIREFEHCTFKAPLLDPERMFCFKCRCQDILRKIVPPGNNPILLARLCQCTIYLREKEYQDARKLAKEEEKRQREAEKKREKKEDQVAEGKWDTANKDDSETSEPTGLEHVVVEEPSDPESGYAASGEGTDDTGGE